MNLNAPITQNLDPLPVQMYQNPHTVLGQKYPYTLKPIVLHQKYKTQLKSLAVALNLAEQTQSFKKMVAQASCHCPGCGWSCLSGP